MSVETLTLDVDAHYRDFALSIEQQLSLAGVTAIFGPSGSGKTTLLRTIAGFVTPQRGSIAHGQQVWFDSARNVDVPVYRRPVGFMFQDARLFPHLDVDGNLTYAENRKRAAITGIDRNDVLAALDLSSLLHRRVNSLSGGERQRVALARTLLTGPRLLLLDEPLAALDRDRKADILPYLQTVTEQFRVPTLYVSHDIDEVAQLADQILVLTEGRIRMFGAAAKIMERLDLEPIMGRFEGGTLVEGRVSRHDERLHLTYVDVHGDLLTMPLISHLPVKHPVRLRIRARDVAIATEHPKKLSIRNVLPGTITDIIEEPELGSAEAFVALRGTRIRARLTQAAVEDLQLVPGMSVWALVKSVSFEGRG